MDQCFCKHRVAKVLEDNNDFCISTVPCHEETGEFEGMCIDIQDKTDGYCIGFVPKYCPFCGEKIRDEWEFDFS